MSSPNTRWFAAFLRRRVAPSILGKSSRINEHVCTISSVHAASSISFSSTRKMEATASANTGRIRLPSAKSEYRTLSCSFFGSVSTEGTSCCSRSWMIICFSFQKFSNDFTVAIMPLAILRQAAHCAHPLRDCPIPLLTQRSRASLQFQSCRVLPAMRRPASGHRSL